MAVTTDPAFAAILLAREAHEGQVDKGGQPYIYHPLRVAARFPFGSNEFIVGCLHDVVEDTDVTLAQVEDMFGWRISEAVDAITRRKGEGDLSYLARIVGNPIAIKVKVSDATDNSDIERLMAIDDPDVRDRLEAKYANMLILLKPHLARLA
jgi:hypothetical protein